MAGCIGMRECKQRRGGSTSRGWRRQAIVYGGWWKSEFVVGEGLLSSP